jgi:hypothetical protein
LCVVVVVVGRVVFLIHPRREITTLDWERGVAAATPQYSFYNTQAELFFLFFARRYRQRRRDSWTSKARSESPSGKHQNVLST